jgi:hypothetical protein
MNLSVALFFDYFKAVTPFVTLGAQLRRLLDRFVRLCGIVPKRKRSVIRIANRLMTYITTDIPPSGLIDRYATFQIGTRRAGDALAGATVERLFSSGCILIPVERRFASRASRIGALPVVKRVRVR